MKSLKQLVESHELSDVSLEDILMTASKKWRKPIQPILTHPAWRRINLAPVPYFMLWVNVCIDPCLVETEVSIRKTLKSRGKKRCQLREAPRTFLVTAKMLFWPFIWISIILCIFFFLLRRLYEPLGVYGALVSSSNSYWISYIDIRFLFRFLSDEGMRKPKPQQVSIIILVLSDCQVKTTDLSPLLSVQSGYNIRPIATPSMKGLILSAYTFFCEVFVFFCSCKTTWFFCCVIVGHSDLHFCFSSLQEPLTKGILLPQVFSSLNFCYFSAPFRLFCVVLTSGQLGLWRVCEILRTTWLCPPTFLPLLPPSPRVHATVFFSSFFRVFFVGLVLPEHTDQIIK